MSNKFKGVLIGIIIGTIISATTTFALNGSMQKVLDYSDIKICIDGERITPTDANGNYVEPFIIDGTTYLPVRAVASTFGKEVSWDGDTRTVYIGKKPEEKYLDAFKENIQSVIDTYGMYVDKEGIGVWGLKYGTLIDFEKDSVPELVLVRDWIVEIYRFDGTKSTKIYEQKAGGRFMQTDVSYTIGINDTLESPCLITYQSVREWCEEELHVVTIKDGKANVQVMYKEGSTFNEESGMLRAFDTFKIDGVAVTENDYESLRSGIFNGEKEVDVCWGEVYSTRENYIHATREELDVFLKKFGL